jgi:hypothetical protein
MRSLALVLFVLLGCRQTSPPKPGAGPAAPEATHELAPPPAQCEVTECGPAMRMPNRRCPDGSMAGPTGRCLRTADGGCAWEIHRCT